MSISLHNLKPAKGARRKFKRLGRGNASGKGTYSTKGQKGQRARSGGRKGLGRLGLRRLVLSTPKRRGFRSLAPRVAVVNIADLERKCVAGEVVTRKRLIELGLLDKSVLKVKLLGDGAITKKIIVRDIPVSTSAKEKILAVGGVIE